MQFSPISKEAKARGLLPALAFSVLLLSLVVAFPPVHAAGTVVQTNGHDFSSGTSQQLAFGSAVTSGDVVVVAVSNIVDDQTAVVSVTDTLGTSFTLPGSFPECSVDADACLWLYYGTLPSSGADAVTVTVSESANDIFIYEASGITPVGAAAAVGSSGASRSASLSTSSTSFTTEGLLVSVGETDEVDSFTAGSGFTLLPKPSGDIFTVTQYSTSGVTSPTTFPMTISSAPDYWVYAAMAFNASAAPSLPEFPVQFQAGVVFAAAIGIYFLARTHGRRGDYSTPGIPQSGNSRRVRR